MTFHFDIYVHPTTCVNYFHLHQSNLSQGVQNCARPNGAVLPLEFMSNYELPRHAQFRRRNAIVADLPGAPNNFQTR